MYEFPRFKVEFYNRRNKTRNFLPASPRATTQSPLKRNFDNGAFGVVAPIATTRYEPHLPTRRHLLSPSMARPNNRQRRLLPRAARTASTGSPPPLDFGHQTSSTPPILLHELHHSTKLAGAFL